MNRLLEQLPDSDSSLRPTAPGGGVYLHFATNTNAVTLWTGAAWYSVTGASFTLPTAAAAGAILVSSAAGTTYASQPRLDAGTATARDAVASPREGDRWRISSGPGAGEEWTYRNGAWATTHDAHALQTHPVSASAPSDRQVLVYVLSTDTWTPMTLFVRTVLAGPSTTDATPTVAGSYTVPAGAYHVEVHVHGLKDDYSEAVGWVIRFVVRNNAGTVTVAGGIPGGLWIEGPYGETNTWTISADISGTSVRLLVTGAAATNITWTAYWVVR